VTIKYLINYQTLHMLPRYRVRCRPVAFT